MTILDLRPSGLPIITTRGATRIVNFQFATDQTGNAFVAFIATRINSPVHVAELGVTIAGDTVTMTIEAADTIAAAGSNQHYWVLTLDGEPLLYDILEVSSIPGAPTTSTVTVELVTATGEATVLVTGGGSGGAQIPYRASYSRYALNAQTVGKPATRFDLDAVALDFGMHGITWDAGTKRFLVPAGVWLLEIGFQADPLPGASGAASMNLFVSINNLVDGASTWTAGVFPSFNFTQAEIIAGASVSTAAGGILFPGTMPSSGVMTTMTAQFVCTGTTGWSMGAVMDAPGDIVSTIATQVYMTLTRVG